MNIRILLPALASLALAACATAPKPLQGQFSPLTPQQTLSTDTAQATASAGIHQVVAATCLSPAHLRLPGCGRAGLSAPDTR